MHARRPGTTINTTSLRCAIKHLCNHANICAINQTFVQTGVYAKVTATYTPESLEYQFKNARKCKVQAK